MIAPDTTDAQSFASNLKLLTDLLPAMHEPARRRAAWRVARGRADLAAAVAAEGYRLDGATAAPSPKAAPSTADAIADLRHAQAVAQNAGAPPADVAAIRNAASGRIHAAALELQKRDPRLSYEAAVVEVTK